MEYEKRHIARFGRPVLYRSTPFSLRRKLYVYKAAKIRVHLLYNVRLVALRFHFTGSLCTIFFSLIFAVSFFFFF